MNSEQTTARPTSAGVLYAESIRLGTGLGVRLLMPAVGAAATFMILEWFSTAFSVSAVVSFAAVETLLLIFVNRRLSKLIQLVEVTRAEPG